MKEELMSPCCDSDIEMFTVYKRVVKLYRTGYFEFSLIQKKQPIEEYLLCSCCGLKLEQKPTVGGFILEAVVE